VGPVRSVVPSKQQRGSLLHEIGSGRCARSPLPDVLVQAAAAAEREAPSCDLETVDAAVHRAERRTRGLEMSGFRRGKSDVGDLRDEDPQVWALSSRNEPVPAEQALFIA